MEREKTQITASDLFDLSRLLIKQIEYFYGEDIGDEEIQDIIELMRINALEFKAEIEQLLGLEMPTSHYANR